MTQPSGIRNWYWCVASSDSCFSSVSHCSLMASCDVCCASRSALFSCPSLPLWFSASICSCMIFANSSPFLAMAAAGTHWAFELRPGFLEEVARQQRERVVQAHAAHPVARAPSSLASWMTVAQAVDCGDDRGSRAAHVGEAQRELGLTRLFAAARCEAPGTLWGGEATVRGLVPRVLHRVRHLLGRER